MYNLFFRLTKFGLQKINFIWVWCCVVRDILNENNAYCTIYTITRVLFGGFLYLVSQTLVYSTRKYNYHLFILYHSLHYWKVIDDEYKWIEVMLLPLMLILTNDWVTGYNMKILSYGRIDFLKSIFTILLKLLKSIWVLQPILEWLKLVFDK